jgi:hypothetical protein
LSVAEIGRRIAQLEHSLAIKTRGCLTIRAYTLPGNIDAVMLMYVGMTQAELTQREVPNPTYLHPVYGKLSQEPCMFKVLGCLCN